MIRVDYETRDPIPAVAEARLHADLPEASGWADVVLISDYDKGVCTPTLLAPRSRRPAQLGVKVIADPIRSPDYSRYRGVHCMTPNRLEAQLATGMTIARPEDALGSAADWSSRWTWRRPGDARPRRHGAGPRRRPRRAGADPAAAGLRHHRRRRHGPVGRRPLPGQRGRLRRGRRAGERRGRPRGREDRRGALDPRGDPPRPDRAPSPRWLQAHGPRPTRRRGPASPQAGQTVVFTNGCFDLLHPGHVRLLRQAAALGDFLVVGLNSDASVRRLKGANRPINPEDARAEVLAALESVDAVTVFDEDTPLELIEAIGPDVLVKGGDYRPDEVVGRAEVEAAGGRLVLIPLVEGHSTTRLVHRAADGAVEATPPKPSRRPTSRGPRPRTSRGTEARTGPLPPCAAGEAVRQQERLTLGLHTPSTSPKRPRVEERSPPEFTRGRFGLVVGRYGRGVCNPSV